MTHPLFSPSQVDGPRLNEITVGRTDLVQRLTTRLVDIATTPTRPHTLLVGPRGSGKTHLLTVALWRARQRTGIADRLAVATLPEDAVGVGSYRDLVAELIRSLDPARAGRARELRQARDTIALEQLLLATAGDRAIVLVLENMDRVFAAIGDEGQRALRALVETSARIALLASTPLLFSAIASRRQPWFGSFDIEHLDDLTPAQASALVAARARDRGESELADFIGGEQGRRRLRVIAALAGGSPRLWLALAASATLESLDPVAPALTSLLEQATPIYQQRLWELPGTEARLVVTLARAGGGITVAQLAKDSGTDAGTVAPTLRRLSDAGWVVGHKWPGTDQRATYYELREPLLRHYLRYREGVRDTLDATVQLLLTEPGRPLPETGFTAAIQAARAGDGTALAALPAELRTLVGAAAEPVAEPGRARSLGG